MAEFSRGYKQLVLLHEGVNKLLREKGGYEIRKNLM